MEPRAALVLLVHVALLGVGGWLVVVDARTHRLPDAIVLPVLGAVGLLAALDAVVTGDASALGRAVIGMVLLCAFYALLRLVSSRGMGGGDVKLAAVIGLVLAWHGWQELAVGAAAAFVLGALYALALIALRRADGSTRIAFGPWMIAGALIGVAVA